MTVTLDQIYAITGIFLLAFTVLTVLDKKQSGLTKSGTATFWGIYGITFIWGKELPPAVVGGLVVVMAAIAGAKWMGMGEYWSATADFRRQLNEALIEGYGAAIENLQATLEATKGAAEKPSLTGALKENTGKVKSQPVKAAAAKDGPSR